MATITQTAPLDQRTEDSRKALLERFPSNRRSYVANTFLYAVRAGARTPLQVVAAVNETLHETHARCVRWNHFTDTIERTFEVMTVLKDQHEEAMAFAAWCIDWEKLTPTEKERLRAVKGESYRRAHMEEQPATDKQIAYVRALGYVGEVTSKAHASELIDRLRRGERVEANS